MVAAEVFDQPRPGAEQHGHQMHANLIDAAGPQQLLADADAEDVDVLAPATACASSSASTELPTKVYTPPSGTCAGVPWETMNVGVRAAPPGPSGPTRAATGRRCAGRRWSLPPCSHCRPGRHGPARHRRKPTRATVGRRLPSAPRAERPPRSHSHRATR